MTKFKLTITVNGMRTEAIVSANNSTQAKKLVEAQYPNCKIYFASIDVIPSK